MESAKPPQSASEYIREGKVAAQREAQREKLDAKAECRTARRSPDEAVFALRFDVIRYPRSSMPSEIDVRDGGRKASTQRSVSHLWPVDVLCRERA